MSATADELRIRQCCSKIGFIVQLSCLPHNTFDIVIVVSYESYSTSESRPMPTLALSVRALTLGAALAALTMISINLFVPAMAQPYAAAQTAKPNATQSPRDEERYKAPIGHRQPRPQDLPPGVDNDEDRSIASERQFDKKLEICRNCFQPWRPIATQHSARSAAMLDTHTQRPSPRKRASRGHRLGL